MRFRPESQRERVLSHGSRRDAATLLGSEVNDQIGGADERIVPVRRNAGSGITVERRRIERSVVGDFRTDLDLRREPMLPAKGHVGVAGGDAGALAVVIVEPLCADRKVVQPVGRIVDVEQERLLVGPASQRDCVPHCAALTELNGMTFGPNGVPPPAMIAATAGLLTFGTLFS